MPKGIICGTLLTLATFAAAFAPGQGLVIEAESGVVSAPFCVTNGYVYQPVQTSSTNGGGAVYDFTITNAGSYYVLAMVCNTNDWTNSFSINIDGEPEDPKMVWEIPPGTGFTRQKVSWRGESNPGGVTFFSLAEGAHQLIIRGRGANAQLDSLTIVRRPSPPTGLRSVVVTP